MIDTLIALTEVMALPLTIAVVVFLFLFCVVRPYFNMLAEKKRLEALAAVEKARLKAKKRKRERSAPTAERPGLTEEAVTFDEPDPADPSAVTAQEKISRLAESNPERAGDLVKEWLKSDD